MNHRLKIATLLGCIILTACSGNPLQKKPAHETARLLENAAAAAMKNLGFKGLGLSSRYAQCMEHRAAPSFQCNNLYEAMAKALAEQEVKASPAQIKDPALYKRIQEDLKEISYFSL